jgi:hypothetical protein
VFLRWRNSIWITGDGDVIFWRWEEITGHLCNFLRTLGGDGESGNACNRVIKGCVCRMGRELFVGKIGVFVGFLERE